jgi:hypothetical protein
MNPSSAPSGFAPHDPLGRRRFLRGLGVCLALPVFESWIPARLLAQTAATGPGGLATTATGAPMRLAWVYVPNGTIPNAWWPTQKGADFPLSRTLASMKNMRRKIQLVGGTNLENATSGPDGGGDHARANATFLTGVRAVKRGAVKVGVSIDQLIANRLGGVTRLPSLELSCDDVRKSTTCDSGYACAYQYNLSWKSENVPTSAEVNPRQVFEKLFGVGANTAERQRNFQQRLATDRSLLDFVMEDAKQMNRELGRHDREKMDQYLTSLRDIETRLQRSEKFGKLPNVDLAAPDASIPRNEDGSQNFPAYLDIMYDLLAMAFQTDATRVATFLLNGEGLQRPHPHIGVSEGHHDCTHHFNNPEKIEKTIKIEEFYTQRFAQFIEKLDTLKDTDGKSVLDNSLIVYGSGHSDGNRHTHNNLPLLVAGTGGGVVKAGHYTHHEGDPPATNLWLSLADCMGVRNIESVGDSTGRLWKV